MPYIDFYDVHLQVEGDPLSLISFSNKHVADGYFSFSSIVPMPTELDYEFNNFVEDGYNALYGHWNALTGYWMFKEAAAKYAYPFPLNSREQVLACIKALGEFGEKRLTLGELFKSNLDLHGHGHAGTWRKQHWGISEDVRDAKIASTDACIDIMFELSVNMPKKLLTILSRQHADLRFIASSVKQNGKGAKKIVMLNGKLLEST